ncbi:MAG TPA: thioesterase domain-containing protein [Thermoanaerobaculia bacterium]|jgi:medium-chain acyl-[acyl-carrier-protein] hydrolase|nr:thioesterase domain-containing protein [Thermoanaerobaculia bacterium]
MSKWFKKYRYRGRDAKLRLFCFPYAGGNASIFEGWEKQLPEWVDVFAIQAPGRTVRFAEPPIASLREKISILAREIKPYLDVPHVFVGHSNGALTAFELARELQRSGAGNLRHLVLSAKRAPHLQRKEPIHSLPYPEFVSRLRELKATPAEILENDELMALLEPMLRADFSLSETHAFDPTIPVTAPVTLFWGEGDAEIPKDDMLAWKQHVASEVDFVEFAGDHFFIHSHEQDFVGRVRTIVERALVA